jgi:sugar/nucleoside kinase (ribokinase family)
MFFPTKEGIVLETPEDVTAQRKLAFELGAKYNIEEKFLSLGGCSVNVAVGLAKLGEEAACYCLVGEDMLGQWIKKELSAANVGADNVVEVPDLKSDLSAIIVDEKSGERIILSNHCASCHFEIEKERLQDGSRWFFVSDLSGKWKENLKNVLEYAKENDIRVAFNPRQQMLHEDIKLVSEYLSACEVVFVNKDEAIEIVSSMQQSAGDEINNEEFLIKELKAMGSRIVVLTDGIRGAWGFDGEQLLHVDALVRKAVDTTGSGDAFASGFLAAHLKNKDLGEALKWGIINSSNSVLEYGGQKGLLDEKGIDSIISQINTKKLN